MDFDLKLVAGDAVQATAPKPLALAGDFLGFVLKAKSRLQHELAPMDDPDVAIIRQVVEEHYLDDRGAPAMYQNIESAVYDDAREIVTLCRMFDGYDEGQLRAFQRLTVLEREGLTGDRHPRKVFDRSPFGITAIVVGVFTIWMTVLRDYTGEDLSELLELIQFNWIAGVMWIVGLFIVIWFILKTVRNNRQVAMLASIERALGLYLNDESSRAS